VRLLVTVINRWNGISSEYVDPTIDPYEDRRSFVESLRILPFGKEVGSH
jgi:hypothetical protein